MAIYGEYSHWNLFHPFNIRVYLKRMEWLLKPILNSLEHLSILYKIRWRTLSNFEDFSTSIYTKP